MTEARGSNLHHMRSYVQSQYSDRAWSQVLESMSEDDASTLRGLLPVGWYPLGLQYRLARAVDTTLGQGDGAEIPNIGRYEAQQDLTVVHRLFLRMANPGFVLEQSGRYWSRFYKSGRWEVTRHSSKTASARLLALEPFDALMADYLGAYIHEMWALMKAEVTTMTSVARSNVIHLDGSWR